MLKHKQLQLNPLTIARVLILLEIFALAFSTAAASVLEVLIFLTCLGVPSVRKKVFDSLKQPMVIMSLLLIGWTGIGVVYSIAPLSEGMDMWSSWRKFLMVPLVVGIFDSLVWKQRLCVFFIVLMGLSALVSFVGYGFDYPIYKYEPGVIANNHATQAMLFTAAVFACLVLLRFPPEDRFFSTGALLVFTGILVLNLLLVTPGRCGYLALIVSVMALIFFGWRHNTRAVTMILAPIIIISVMLAFPVPRARMLLILDEMRTYEQDQHETSIGLRMVWWQNTIAMLAKMEHPVIGYGTGGFERAYEKHVPERDGWQGRPTKDPHNQYLKMMAEHGSVGLVLFLCFIASFFRQAVQGTYYYMGIGILLAWCVTSLIAGHFTTFHEGRFLLIWCGAMLAQVPTGIKKPTRTITSH